MEVIAVEDNTILEELIIDKKILEIDNYFFKKVVYFLLKKIVLDFCLQLYDTKGYIAAILMIKSRNKDSILLKELNYKNLNISKSQYFLALKVLKEEKYICVKNKKICLNRKKINELLRLLGDKE